MYGERWKSSHLANHVTCENVKLIRTQRVQHYHLIAWCTILCYSSEVGSSFHVDIEDVVHPEDSS